MSKNKNRNAQRYITVQSLTCQIEFKTRSHRIADTTHSSNVFQSATHIVLGALVGTALQKQPHAFSATLRGGAYQCNVSVLNMALPCIYRDDRSMQKSQPTQRHEAKMSTKQACAYDHVDAIIHTTIIPGNWETHEYGSKLQLYLNIKLDFTDSRCQNQTVNKFDMLRAFPKIQRTEFVAFVSAPFSKSRRTQSVWPFAAAASNAVCPCWRKDI
jgi:hypothetical protein